MTGKGLHRTGVESRQGLAGSVEDLEGDPRNHTLENFVGSRVLDNPNGFFSQGTYCSVDRRGGGEQSGAPETERECVTQLGGSPPGEGNPAGDINLTCDHSVQPIFDGLSNSVVDLTSTCLCPNLLQNLDA